MKTATSNLEFDHIYILKLTDVMEKMALSGNPLIEDVERVVRLIRYFADGIHHEKEERLLFPLMAKRGFSLEQGPVAVMLHEHVLGRNYVRGMVEGIELNKAGNSDGVGMICRNLLGYVELLRNHIHKENNILFRMADQALSTHDQEDLLNSFSLAEDSGKNGITKASGIAEINALADRYKLGD